MVDYHTPSFLPAPNLWERLAARQVRGVVVQPAVFFGTPLTGMLYRGAGMRGYSSPSEVDPAYLVTGSTRTLAMIYHHAVDVAAHEKGQRSSEYRQAIAGAGRLWARLARRLPPDTVMVGTSDHGHMDIPESDKIKLAKADTDGLRWWGDSRSLMLSGPSDRIRTLAERTGADPDPRRPAPQVAGPGQTPSATRIPHARRPAAGPRRALGSSPKAWTPERPATTAASPPPKFKSHCW